MHHYWKRVRHLVHPGGKKLFLRNSDWNKDTKRTCWKEIVLHSVPMVQESKKAVPSWAHKEAACIASQLSSAVSLEPSLNSNTQALNPYWFSHSSQKSGAIATFWFLNSVTEWSQNLNFLHAVKTFWVKNLFASKQVSAGCTDIEFSNLEAAYEKEKKRHWVSSWEKYCYFLFFHQANVCNCELLSHLVH